MASAAPFSLARRDSPQPTITGTDRKTAKAATRFIVMLARMILVAPSH